MGKKVLSNKDAYKAMKNYGQYAGHYFYCEVDENRIIIDYWLDFDTIDLSKMEYEKIEKILDSIRFDTKNFEVYISYDGSGYDYWTRIMEEPLRPSICIRSNKDGYIPSPGIVCRYIDKCFQSLQQQLDDAEINPWRNKAA